ncbi:MAG: hypothetical protein ACI97P_002089, partial [Arcticibacterium sp.]
MSIVKKGFVHTVFFWLKEKSNLDHYNNLHEGLLKLADNGLMIDSYVGKPAKTDRT